MLESTPQKLQRKPGEPGGEKARLLAEAIKALQESFIEAIREHPFDGYTLCRCRSEKFDIPMEELAKKYPKVNRYVFEAEQRKAYAEHVAEIAGAMLERAAEGKA